MAVSYRLDRQVAALSEVLKERQTAVESETHLKSVKDPAVALGKKIDAIENGPKSAPGFGPANRDLTRLFSAIESGIRDRRARCDQRSESSANRSMQT